MRLSNQINHIHYKVVNPEDIRALLILKLVRQDWENLDKLAEWM